jgi:hypothetical protein
MAISVDELANNRHMYVGTKVEVEGTLCKYCIDTGLLAGPSTFKLGGEDWNIGIRSERKVPEGRKLKCYLDAFLGQEVSFEVGVLDRNYTNAIKLGDRRFSW